MTVYVEVRGMSIGGFSAFRPQESAAIVAAVVPGERSER
jgi:hypothetical protein